MFKTEQLSKGKTMNILIIDDNADNLEAAKQATENFSEHTFQFASNAKEALVLISEADAVITDLFFQKENHDDGEELGILYNLYRLKMHHDQTVDMLILNYYSGDRRRAMERFQNVDAVCEEGNSRLVLEKAIEASVGGREAYINWLRESLRNLPLPQFPYGGALMLLAKELGKKHCLVSDIHSHTSAPHSNPALAIDGIILLIPLIKEGVISYEEGRTDGNLSLTYMGCNEIGKLSKVKYDVAAVAGTPPVYVANNGKVYMHGKNNPDIWIEAISRILKQ